MPADLNRLYSDLLVTAKGRRGNAGLSVKSVRNVHAMLTKVLGDAVRDGLQLAGIPVKVVSERLGHASPVYTMPVYQHVLPGMQADADRAFGDLIRPDATPSVGHASSPAEFVGRALDADASPRREEGAPSTETPSCPALS